MFVGINSLLILSNKYELDKIEFVAVWHFSHDSREQTPVDMRFNMCLPATLPKIN